jgi:hypothetical protein
VRAELREGHSLSERVVIERRARATGTRVYLVHNPDGDPDCPWETICADHGGVCSHVTRKLAEGWLSHPDEWCDGCMNGKG